MAIDNPACFDAADVNDDGVIDTADKEYLLDYLFEGGPPPPYPGPTTCNRDPTGDGLSFGTYTSCP